MAVRLGRQPGAGAGRLGRHAAAAGLRRAAESRAVLPRRLPRSGWAFARSAVEVPTDRCVSTVGDHWSNGHARSPRRRRPASARSRHFGGGRADGHAARRDAARRQGREPRRDEPARPAGAARIHDRHRRRARAFHAAGGRCPTARAGRGPAAPSPGWSARRDALGRPERPLLVSVRSRRAVSMPGMMDTVLNLGLTTRRVRRARLRATGNRALRARRATAASSRCTATSCWASSASASSACSRSAGARRRAAPTPTLRRAALEEVVAEYLDDRPRSTRARLSRRTRDAQLWRAIDAVFRSWNTRARSSTADPRDPGPAGTAVNVQAMVFGNLGRRLRDRRRASRATPRRARTCFYGEYLMNAQGEDVVAGHPHAAAASTGLAVDGACPGVPGAARRRARGSSSTTATCRTSSSRSRAARSRSSRRATASARHAPRCASRSRWWTRA